MKRIIYTTICCFIASISFGQIEQGSAYAFGAFSLMSTTNKTTSGSTTSTTSKDAFNYFDAGAVYLFTNNIAGGIRVDFGQQKMDYSDDNNTLIYKDGWSHFGLFGRYFVPCAGSLYSSFELQANFGSGKDRFDDGSSVTTIAEYSDFELAVVPGLTFFFSPTVAFELNYGWLGYRTSSATMDPGESTEEKVTTNYTGLNLNSKTLRIGFCWFFM